jgi:hypothetical protein
MLHAIATDRARAAYAEGQNDPLEVDHADH